MYVGKHGFDHCLWPGSFHGFNSPGFSKVGGFKHGIFLKKL